MHVAILGAGALGRVYGTRLACETAERVSFVLRSGHAHGGAYRLQRVDDASQEHVLGDPVQVDAVPRDADAVLVCVRAEQLGEVLEATRPAHRAVIVTLTPLMPEDRAALRADLGDRLVVGMPGVVAYFSPDGHVRYWLPHVAATLIEERIAPAHEAIVSELARALDASGVPTKREQHVHETNAATTIVFMPLGMGVAAAGGVEPLLADDALLDTAIAATKEAVRVAERIGRAPHWAERLVQFVGPNTLKVGVGIARQTHAEAVRYVDQHFGTKLDLQSAVMGAKLAKLAEHEGLEHAAIDALVARMAARRAGDRGRPS